MVEPVRKHSLGPGKPAAQVAGELGVSPPTLKNWAKEFAGFLSAPGPLTDGMRRFTDDDQLVLKRIKDHLAGGLTLEETAAQLRDEGYGDGYAGPEEPAPPASEPLPDVEARALATTPNAAQQGFVALTETLRAMVENQQTIQNSLQVNRNLLGVIIQDNFNLKEENSRLRDRMLKLEQELSEAKRREADYRLYLEQRVGRIEQNLRTALTEARKGLWARLFGG